jgi:hypothetical protein
MKEIEGRSIGNHVWRVDVSGGEGIEFLRYIVPGILA